MGKPSKVAASYWKQLLQTLLIIGVGTLIFAPALYSPWYGDDDVYLLSNPLLSDPARLWKAWFETACQSFPKNITSPFPFRMTSWMATT